ncbi:WecB/TagA/CpsF family glycosyltransferase [Marinobacter sp. CA1]|uniref:WecB/TagA/CpsF family glycosyltransferase n=1 Tax=Marinobacter sp. CA1 TaxID=2817656 RepID=UPI001D065ECD|nr:WecB/TagA/CpsF family glycosyltransferase [Marinobacter sp. CA1]UDL07028.1 WecB/TagA/CpsF family glycosyltransferase [Marinobacter sp. CA1]
MTPTSSRMSSSLLYLAEPATDRLLNIPFANIDLESAKERIFAALHAQESTNLFFINAHCLNVSHENADYYRALTEAELVFPDGSGVEKGCKLHGGELVANLNGTDLFPHICEIAASNGTPVFLLGARPGVADKVAQWAAEQYSDLQIAGVQHGYFSLEDEDAIIDNINCSGAKLLIVAMGVPMQELWLKRVQSRLHTRLNIAVGGLFDFYSGRIPRAPLWMREAGTEWLWRFLQEPRRMWRRYFLGNPIYIRRVKREVQIKRWIALLPDHLTTPWNRKFLALRSQLSKARYRFEIAGSEKAKRLSDIVLSSCALLALLPLFLMVAAAIKIESPGPVFFGQVRAGVRGRPFKLWKFRSMAEDAEARRAELEALNEIDDGVTFKIRNDPRVTRVGRIIRKLSIDELPQFFNVLRNEMSIVGPRPGLYAEIAKYELSQRMRLDIKPGLTSEWVVAGRNNLSFSEQAALDVDYRNRRSFWLDLKLMIKTVPAVLAGRGAS